MIITENINMKDSAIFMGFVRKALVESLSEKNASEDMIKYISENALDCEVLSLAMYGKKCPSDDPVFAETFLMNEFKEYMLENAQDFKFDSSYSMGTFFSEIDGLAACGTDAISYLNEEEELVGPPVPFMVRVKNAVGADDIAKGWNTFKQYLNGIPGDLKRHYRGTKKAVGQIARGVKSIYSQNTNFADTVNVIGAAALVGAASFLAYKTYQRFFSKAAKQCQDKSGNEKVICMTNVRKQSIQKQIVALKHAMSSCNKSKDPAACRASLNKKIQALQAKM